MKNGTTNITTRVTDSRIWEDAEGQRLHKRHRRGENWIHGLRIGSRILDIVSSYLPFPVPTFLSPSGSIAMMSLNISKYYQTQTITNGSNQLWSNQTFTWPNYLPLIASAVTWIGAAVVLIAYCKGRAHAERMHVKRSRAAKLVLVLASALASSVAMFKTRDNINSLSGQTCGAPDSKPPMFPQVNFAKFCLMQDITNELLLTHVITGIITILTYTSTCMHTRTKKDIKKRIAKNASNIAMDTQNDFKGYSNVTYPGQETGYLAVLQPGGRRYNY